MATFIPEWTGTLPMYDRKVKEVLSALDDAFVVRRPLTERGSSPLFFVQHPTAGWLAVATSPTPFADLAPMPLFAAAEPSIFDSLIERLDAVDAVATDTKGVVAKVLLMWNCTSEQAARVASWNRDRFSGQCLSREQLLAAGPAVLVRHMSPVSARHNDDLLAHHFPETQVRPQVVRRRIHRDNGARLQGHFLDVQQEWASKLDLLAPAGHLGLARDFTVRLVNGVAGSGKTLIVVSRASLLARRFPLQRILVTSHNTPLIADLEVRLLRSSESPMPNLVVRTFYSLATAEWRRLHQRPVNPVDRPTLSGLLELGLKEHSGLTITKAQLSDEIEFIDDMLLPSEEAYLEVSRTGRGFALRPKDRAQIWDLRTWLLAELTKAGVHLWSSIPREICEAGADSWSPRFDHVLIDEAQFFAPAWFEVIKTWLAPGGHLFLCAVPNQGFLRSRLSWRRAGIDVTGRTKNLRRPYRSTRALLAAATSLLPQVAADDEHFLQPDLSEAEPGKPPLLIQAASSQDAVDQVVNEVVTIDQEGHLRLADVLVMYGDRINRDQLYDSLCARLGPGRIWWLNKEGEKRAPSAMATNDMLRLVKVDSATGLEGTIVFLLGAERLLASDLESDARKLYMAMTRAARHLVLVTAETPSDRVAAVFQRRE